MRFFFRSLNRKIIVFHGIILCISLSVSSFISIRNVASHSYQAANNWVQTFADILHTTVVQAMEEGRNKDLPVMIRSLSSQREFMIVRIFDNGGKIIESTGRGEKGKFIDLPHISQMQNKGVVLTRSSKGGKIFRALRPFYNNPKCSRCHGKEKRVLAYLCVDLPWASFEQQIKSHSLVHFFSDFGVVLAICGAMFVFSLFITRPIREVSKRMVNMVKTGESGDYDVQIPVKTTDEIGQLTSSFNFMVKNLREMRKREEEHQELLLSSNEDLQKKVQELNVLYESSKAVNQSLQIEEILRMTIEKVTRSLGFDRVVLAIFDEKRETLRGKWSIGIDEEIVQQVHIPKEGIKGVLFETYQKREPIVVKDTSALLSVNSKEVRKCWEVLNCQNKECPVYGEEELRCWMTRGTKCDLEMREDTFEEKIRVCGVCPYLKEVVKGSDIVNLLLFGSHSFISVPLIVREDVLGILLADKLHSGKEITEEDIKLLMTFLSHVSMAIENAFLYNRLEEKVDLSQKQLQETNEQLRRKIEELNTIRNFNESILQNLYGGIVTYDKEGIITFMNRSGAELLEWKESEVLGRSIDEVLYGGAENPSLFRKILLENGVRSGEVEILKKGGEKIPVEIFLSYLQDEDGNIAGITGIFRDITEKKEIEIQMHRMDKLASLGQLASGIAHEIKNPLAGIGSAIQVLSKRIRIDDTQKEVIKVILNQIHRLDETIKSLLSFAKPGKPKLTPTDLNEVFETVLFLVTQQMRKQDIQIRLDIPQDLPKIMVDPQQIQQSLLNIVLNAVEAMPSGGTLTVSIKEKAIESSSKKAGKPHLSLVISDTGTGISEEVLSQIFNPFFTTKPSGTGLGLSITQRIIEQHNGRIDIKSETGKGTSFTIDLPI